MKKNKVLHAIRQGKVGGGETHVMDLVHALNGSKFECVILSFTAGPMVDKLREEGFVVYIIETITPFDMRVWKRVADIIKFEKIEIIHAHGTRAASNTFYAARSLNLPLIYTVHGWSFHPNQNRLVRFLRMKSEEFLVNNAHRTICVSNSNLKEGKRYFPMLRATVILNGVNQEKFTPFKIYPNVRHEFGLHAKDKVIGYIARLTAQKDPLTFIKAFSYVVDPHARCLVIGDGEMKHEMVKLSEHLQIDDRMIFKGFRDDIPAILKEVDVFCLPSLWEGLPIALIEAMSMQKAVIATSIDGITDLIVTEYNGLLVKPADPQELGKALNRILADETLRVKLGKNARETILINYGVKEMTRKVVKIYEQTRLLS